VFPSLDVFIIPYFWLFVNSFLKKIMHKKIEFFTKIFVQCAQTQISGAPTVADKKRGLEASLLLLFFVSLFGGKLPTRAHGNKAYLVDLSCVSGFEIHHFELLPLSHLVITL
jgi:hypothetical protein